MQKIGLHTIFRHLVGNENFLTIIEVPNDVALPAKKQKNTQEPMNKVTNMMSDMISDYLTLSLHDIQKYTLFPSEFKSILHPECVRCGVKTFVEKNSMNINVSFLNSLNILLRPELFKSKVEDQMRNYSLFEEFIVTKIHGNCRIDKVKNTKKIKATNAELVKNLLHGKITIELIQFIINIFEINLLIFDFVKNEIIFFWSCGHKYPFVNLFNDMYCMADIRGVYEPIMPLSNKIPTEHVQKMYTQILTDAEDYLNCAFPIKVASHSLIQINQWDISPKKYLEIVLKYFDEPLNDINFDI